MRKNHVFIRRDGTTFEEKVEAGALTVEMYCDPETVALRIFASAVDRLHNWPKAAGAKANLASAADRLWHLTQGRYGWPKRSR